MVRAGEPNGRGGWFQDWLPQIIATVRGGMHVRATAYQFGRSRQLRWLALGAAGLVADVAITKRIAGGRAPNHLRWAAMDALDGAAWALAHEHGHEIQDIVVGDGWTHAAIHSFLATTGRDAKPVPNGAAAFPPATARDAIETLVEWSISGAAPLIGATLVHRARGLRTSASQLLWTIEGGVSGVLLGRIRAGQHRRAEEIWRKRSARGRVLAERSVQFEMATGVEELHDLPRLLAIIGEHHEPCRLASLEARDRPRSLASDPALGGPLARTLPYHDVEPSTVRMLWLTTQQAEQLRTAVAAAEAEAGSATAAEAEEGRPLRLVGSRGRSLRFEYLGREFDLDAAPELADLVFDPVAVGLVGAALVKLVSIRWLRVPKVAGVSSGLLELLAGVTLLRSEITGRRHVTSVVRLSMASCLIWCAAVRFGDPVEIHPDGTPIFPVTSGVAVLGPIGNYWDDLPLTGRFAAVVALAAWVETMRSRRNRPTPETAVAEFVTVLQYFLATFRLSGAADRERTFLEERLRAVHEEDMLQVEREVRGRELQRYGGLLALARVGLAEAEATGSLDDSDVARLSANLDGIERWLEEAAR